MRSLKQIQDQLGNSWPGSILPPQVTQPQDGVTGLLVTLGLNLATGPFVSTEGADQHVGTDWEIRTAPNGGGTVRWSSTNNTVNLLGIVVPALTLALGQDYYVRARFRGSASGLGAWSADVHIST